MGELDADGLPPGPWNPADILGPDGEDWRVPVSELEARQTELRRRLTEADIESLLIQHPVDLHYYSGGRQQAVLWVPADGLEAPDGGPAIPVQWARRSLRRAAWDAGGSDAPHEVHEHPSSALWGEALAANGATRMPALQLGVVPHAHAERTWSLLARSFDGARPEDRFADGMAVVHAQREVKSAWEIENHRQAGAIVTRMFEAITEQMGEGRTELEVAALAERMGREAGFSGHVDTRRYPMNCDRAVVVAGRSGGIPSFFDAAVGGGGGSPASAMGAGHRRIRRGEPVLVDIVHAHRGSIADMTRMFSVGEPSPAWVERMEDMWELQHLVVDGIGRGDDCSRIWEAGRARAEAQGWGDHLMGMPPDQTRFLSHAVGLELDESPVVAAGFDRPVPVGGVMAVEPKIVFEDGAVGPEDCWVRGPEGMECLTGGDAIPGWTVW